MRRPILIVLGTSFGMFFAGCMSMEEIKSVGGNMLNETRNAAIATVLQPAAQPTPQQTAPVVQKPKQTPAAQPAPQQTAPIPPKPVQVPSNPEEAFEFAFKTEFEHPGEGLKFAKNVKIDAVKATEFIMTQAKGLLEEIDSAQQKLKIPGHGITAAQINELMKTFDAFYAAIKVFAPFATDGKTMLEYLALERIKKSKGTDYDLYTPFYGIARTAALASLSDDDRSKLLEVDDVVYLRNFKFILDTSLAAKRHDVQAGMSDKRARMAHAGVSAEGMGGCYEEPEYDYLVTESELVALFNDKSLGERLLTERRSRAEKKLARERADRIKALPPAEQKSEIDKIQDPNERKNTVFAIIDSLKDFERVTDSHKEMLKTIPAKDLAAQLRLAAKEMRGNEQQYRASGPAAAAAIKDQAVIKDLLVDDPSWAHEIGLEKDFGKAYTALLKNCTDDDVLEKVFREAKPDEDDRIVSKWELRNVFKYMSAERRAKLLAEAWGRADEAAKSNVVVKRYYLGMSLADFCLVNDANGMSATAKTDNQERITDIYFNNDKRDSFLNVGKGMDGIAKFVALYCKVPDGVDLSQNSRTEMKKVMRSIKHLNFDDNKPGKYWWEYSNFAKYVDHPHNFQVEIQDENGQLTLRYPVDEGVIGTVDKTQEEQDNLLNAFL